MSSLDEDKINKNEINSHLTLVFKALDSKGEKYVAIRNVRGLVLISRFGVSDVLLIDMWTFLQTH